MKATTLLLTSLFSTSLIYASTNSEMTQTDIKKEGIQYIQMLGSTLKRELQIHMKADKTGLSAMGFCSAKAEEITKEVNKSLPDNVSVRRTALKIRNPDNIPDTLDMDVMKAYEESIDDKSFKPSDIKVLKDGDTFRIYKPLITQGVCLKCHGSHISKEIQEMISIHYPKDKAVEFKEGSLRGVIVSEIKK